MLNFKTRVHPIELYSAFAPPISFLYPLLFYMSVKNGQMLEQG